MDRKTTLSFLLCTLLGMANSQADQRISAARVDTMPVVDGAADDQAWVEAKAIVTRDSVAELDISLKAVYDSSHIAFLVSFPDASEDREHKAMIWDKQQNLYKTGPKREDVFVFKWNMEPVPVDLTLSADNSYKADVWFWKANRTDHAGYADDKVQLYVTDPLPNTQRMISAKGNLFYLKRKGDAGKAAYQATVHTDFVGDEAPRFEQQKPEGSRADIRAKGHWANGFWTIEFSRPLNTSQTDDVIFDPKNTYVFGVSRFEIAGRSPNPQLDQPKYGSGEIGEHIVLEFD